MSLFVLIGIVAGSKWFRPSHCSTTVGATAGLLQRQVSQFRSWKRKRLVLRRDVTVARNVAVAQRSYIINSTLAEPSELANRVARVVCKSCQERQHSR